MHALDRVYMYCNMCIVHIVHHRSSKEALQAINSLNSYLLQHEKNIPGVIYTLHKVKDRVNFGLSGKKKEATIDSYF